VQINANHRPEAIDGLLQALQALQRVLPLPGPEELLQHAA
jgi:hypothetical protein